MKRGNKRGKEGIGGRLDGGKRVDEGGRERGMEGGGRKRENDQNCSILNAL